MTDLAWRTSDGFGAALLAKLPLAVVVTDQDDAIVCWNLLAEELYGYSAGEVLGMPLSGLRIGPADESLARSIRRSATTEGAWSGEYDTRGKDGEPIRVSTTITRITADDWNFDGFINVSVGVSGRSDLNDCLSPLTGVSGRRLILDLVVGGALVTTPG